MTTQTVRIPDGFRLDSNAYTDTRHYTYISTPLHDTSRGWLALHHGVQIETRDSAPIVAPDPVTAPDAMMSLTAIEHLDFEPEVPCDGVWDGELCQNAAFGVVVALCRGCREGGRSFICRRCWAECQTAGWLCPSCDRSCEPRFIRLVVTFR